MGGTLTIEAVVEMFLLLLIGIGPKIALVPYVETTKDMDKATKAKVMHKMLATAGSVGLILVILGEFLARLLHFSTGSLSIAGGIILLIISITMVLGSGDENADHSSIKDDPMKAAVYPLAVPYLLNPAGIVAPGDAVQRCRHIGARWRGGGAPRADARDRLLGLPVGEQGEQASG